MSRRAGLPAADELFRRTGPAGRPLEVVLASPVAVVSPDEEMAATSGALGVSAAELASAPAELASSGPATARVRKGRSAGARGPGAAGLPAPTGRERHEEKITVYVSAAELVDLERARLTLRAEHGLGVDRGRIVREALAVVLADLEAQQEDSILVRRLRDQPA